MKIVLKIYTDGDYRIDHPKHLIQDNITIICKRQEKSKAIYAIIGFLKKCKVIEGYMPENMQTLIDNTIYELKLTKDSCYIANGNQYIDITIGADFLTYNI